MPEINAGPADPNDDAVRAAQRLGLPPRFRVSGRLGHGGMGVVYGAFDDVLGRDVAIKVLLADTDQARFQREARLAASLRSPHVVTIHDLLELPGDTWAIVMERVAGRGLDQVIDAGPLEEPALEHIMRDCATGMLAAERAGIVHRDFKPSNVLLEHSGAAKVSDFGLAKSIASRARYTGETAEGSMGGTAHYMAPEQADNLKAADTRSDIYSFGASFYHAAAGRPPFDDPSPFALYFMHKTEPLTSLRAVRPSLSPTLTDVIERSLAKAPADRFQSFADVIAALSDASVNPWDAAPDPAIEGYLAQYRAARGALLAGPPAGLSLTFPSGSTFAARFGNLTHSDCDAIVSSDDMMLSMTGGVSQAIRVAGGDDIPSDAWKYVPIRRGGVVVSGAGTLKSRFVFHAVTIEYTPRAGFKPREPILPTRDIILQLLNGCLYHADTLPVRTLALPLLGTGAGGLARDVCLDGIVGFFIRTLARGTTSLERVELVLRPPMSP